MPHTHYCNLSRQEVIGFPKLPPNASLSSRFVRKLRKFIAINPKNAKCKTYFHNRSGLLSEAKYCAKNPYFFVIHPFSNCHTFIEVIFFIIWLYSLITDPLEIFCSSCDFSTTLSSQIDRYFVLIVQRILIVLFFVDGYLDNKSQKIVTDPKKIIMRYLRTYFFFDFMSTGTVTTPIIEYIRTHYTEEVYLRVSSGLKIFLILCYYARFNTVTDYMQSIFQSLKLPKAIQSIAVHILRIYLILHLCACVLYGVPKTLYVKDWPKESWTVQAHIDPNSGNSFMTGYFESLLVVVCYFFGASHGKYNITLPNEQLCLSVLTLLGRLYTLFLLADLLKVFGITNVAESSYEQELYCLDEYISSRNLPENLRKRLMSFYEYKLRKHYFNEREIFSTLSEHLRTELFLFAARKLIKRLFVFKTVPNSILCSLVSLMKLETYSPKDAIIEIGASVKDIYFISNGTVSVKNKDGLELCHLEDSDEFGIISTMSDSIQNYRIEAVEATEIIYINKEMFLNVLHDHTDVLIQMDEMVKKRLVKLRKLQEKIDKGSPNVISDLRNGRILETFKKRPLVAE